MASILTPCAALAATCITANSNHGWAHLALAPETSTFTATVDARTSDKPTDSIIGFSNDTQNAFDGFAVLLRFNKDGFIDARNGAAYAAVHHVAYHSGVIYSFTLSVDVVNHVYSAWVTPRVSKAATIQIAKDFAFRTTQANVFALDSLGAIDNDGDGHLDVCNISETATAPQIPNPECTLIIPANPLSAIGLATPYRLLASNNDGACHETNPAQSAFVQAAVFDPATSQISIFNPLVIDDGTIPAVNPVVPKLPANAVVAIWFGYNGDMLTFHGVGNALAEGNCVNGNAKGVFGQFGYCNAPAFFAAANKAIAAGKLVVPALGTANDGKACPTSRDFFVVDQDPSDNLTTTYLNTPKGVAQNNAVNRGLFPTATVFGNPSDERLVDLALDPAFGCTPWKVADLADPGSVVPGLALNELLAAARQAAPIAFVPLLDPMALTDGVADIGKLNLYRAGVDQPPVANAGQDDPTLWCSNMRTIATARLKLDQVLLTGRPSPLPDVANSLFTFMVQRYVASYGNLDCQQLLKLPVNASFVTDPATGVVTSATIQ